MKFTFEVKGVAFDFTCLVLNAAFLFLRSLFNRDPRFSHTLLIWET